MDLGSDWQVQSRIGPEDMSLMSQIEDEHGGVVAMKFRRGGNLNEVEMKAKLSWRQGGSRLAVEGVNRRGEEVMKNTLVVMLAGGS